MKKIIFLFAFMISLTCVAQENPQIQDPEAGKILERVVQKLQSLPALQTDFELVIEDRKENSRNASTGSLLLKQKKYKLTSEGSIVYFDGTTMWTYVTENNEVTITEPKSNSTDFMSNPAVFFSAYKTDFKYRYVGNTTRSGVPCYEIDLFPKNLNQPYSRVKVFVNTKNDLPVIIKSIGKDGVDYTVTLRNIVSDQEVTDAAFTFDPSKFRKVEIVDMRGL